MPAAAAKAARLDTAAAPATASAANATPRDARHASPIQSAALCTAPTRRITCDRAVALKTSPVVAESAAQSPKPASTRTAGTAPSQRGPRTTAISSGASSARPTDVGMLNTATIRSRRSSSCTSASAGKSTSLTTKVKPVRGSVASRNAMV